MNRLQMNFAIVTALGSVMAVSACGDDSPAKKRPDEPDAAAGGDSGGGGEGSGGRGNGGRGSGGEATSGGTAGMMGGGGMAPPDASVEGGRVDSGMEGGHHMEGGMMMEGGHHHPDAGGACGQIVAACHPVDPANDGPISDCHGTGDAGAEEACEEALDECKTTCGEPLCERIVSTCHAVDPGDGPLHDCHGIGHAADAAACFDNVHCLHLCEEAAGDGGAGHMMNVSIHFVAKVNGTDAACGTAFADQGSTDVEAELRDLRFYVQDLRLINDADEEVPVMMADRLPWQIQNPDLALVDLEDGTGACATNGTTEVNAVITGMVPHGTYTGVVFSNGVPEALNHADPTTLPAPLQLGYLSWNWLLGHRFVVAELAATASPADGAAPGLGLIHLGSTQCSNTAGPDGGVDPGQPPSVACARPNRNEIRLTGFDPMSDRIAVDVGALFANTDLSGASLCHSMGAACPPLFTALGVSGSDGSPTHTQTVYSVE